MATRSNLRYLAAAVDMRIEAAQRKSLAHRLWAKDASLWPHTTPQEITGRLGWLTAPGWASGHLHEIHSLADGMVADGFRQGLLVGMGGSSITANVLRRMFGVPADALNLRILHRHGWDQSIDEAEELCLRKLEKSLSQLLMGCFQWSSITRCTFARSASKRSPGPAANAAMSLVRRWA